MTTRRAYRWFTLSEVYGPDSTSGLPYQANNIPGGGACSQDLQASGFDFSRFC